MRKGFAALAIAGVAVTVALFAMTTLTPKAVTMYAQEDDYAFIQFLAKYGKSYVSKNEHLKRAEIFKANMQMIREENQRGENTFSLGVNRFADMSEVDFKREKVNNMNSYNMKTSSQAFVGEPSPVDWRNKSRVSDVMNEGSCDSDWAISTASVMETRSYIRNNDTFYVLSVQQLLDCARSEYRNDGCDDGRIDTPYTYAKVVGMMQAKDYPYVGYTSTCRFQQSQVTPVRPTGFQQVDRMNVTDLKIAVSFGPVSALIEADRQVFRLYQRGILNTDKCGYDADHAVAIVGWGRDLVNRIDYWIVKNTWGVGWGEQGYVRIAIYEGSGVCGIQLLAFYPTF